jgi:DNA polymerase III subunit epsilon
LERKIEEKVQIRFHDATDCKNPVTKRAIFYDTETTGTRPGKDRVIEIAAYDPERPGEEKSFCTLTHPDCPIPAESTAISGITDEMVANAPPIRAALSSFLEFCSGDVCLIAHNNDAFDKLFLVAEFERAKLKMPSWIFIDSLKWSRKYRSDLPRHSLQSLREVYGIAANQAHRALDDCIVLHQVFSRMVGDLSLDEIIDLLSTQAKIVRMPFGKHAGKNLTEVPKDYIAWLSGSGALDKPENALLRETLEKLGRL